MLLAPCAPSARDVRGTLTGSEPVVLHPGVRVGQTVVMLRFTRPTRATIAALGLTTALTLSACSDLPEVNVTGEQLSQFVEDAKSQVKTIAADAQTVGSSIGTLPENLRSTAQDAIASAQSAAGKATGALEDAQAEGSDAQQRLDDAKTALDDATTKLTELKDAAGENVTPEVQKAIDGLQTQVDSLAEKVADARS